MTSSDKVMGLIKRVLSEMNPLSPNFLGGDIPYKCNDGEDECNDGEDECIVPSIIQKVQEYLDDNPIRRRGINRLDIIAHETRCAATLNQVFFNVIQGLPEACLMSDMQKKALAAMIALNPREHLNLE